MLFLGLGTGLGSALIVDNVLAPVELAHLAYKKGRSYEDYVGAAADQASARHAPGTECTRIRRRISPVEKAVQWINSRAIRSSCEAKENIHKSRGLVAASDIPTRIHVKTQCLAHLASSPAGPPVRRKAWARRIIRAARSGSRSA